MIRQSVKILSAVLAVAILAVLPGCSSNDQIKVRTSGVKDAQLESSFSITGALLPVQSVELAAPFSGKVTEVFVSVGDEVEQGQILAKMDDVQLNAQLEQAISNYQQMLRTQAQARINMEDALASLERTKLLYAEGAAAKVQVESAQKAYDLASSQYDSDASVAAAKASVDSIYTQLGNAAIRSPFSGVVLSRNINAGENASMGSMVFSVGDMSALKLSGTISQEALPYIKNGDPVDLQVDIYPDRTFHGSIESIGSMSLSTGSYFPVEINLTNNEGLVSGLSANAEIKIKGEIRMIVPRTAVVEKGGESYIFIVEDGVVKKQSVITGLRNDNEIEILKGLDGSETVAISNANNLFDEMAVQIVKE